MNIERFNQFLGKQNMKVTRTEIQEVFPDVRDKKLVISNLPWIFTFNVEKMKHYQDVHAF